MEEYEMNELTHDMAKTLDAVIIDYTQLKQRFISEASAHQALFVDKVQMVQVFDLLVRVFGEEAIQEWQLAFAQSEIRRVKERLNDEQLAFRVMPLTPDVVGIGIFLKTQMGEQLFLMANPFTRECCIFEHAQKQALEQTLKQAKLDVQVLNDKLELLALADENPLHLAGESNLLMVDMLIRRKKYGEERKAQATQLMLELDALQAEVRACTLALADCESEALQQKQYQKRCLGRLIDVYGYREQYLET